MTAAVFLLAVQMSVAPAAPTVGDSVTLTLLDEGTIGAVLPTSCAEVVDRRADAIVVRSFEVGECGVRFTLGSDPSVTHEATFTVVSVLTEEDPAPSPYREPVEIAIDHRAWWSIGVAAAAALLTWTLVFLKRKAVASLPPPVPMLEPFEELRAALTSIGEGSGPDEQIVVAEALRRYLHRSDRRLTIDRSTGEVLRWMERRRDPRLELVRRILVAGDRAKFAPQEERTPLPTLRETLNAFLQLESQRRETRAG